MEKFIDYLRFNISIAFLYNKCSKKIYLMGYTTNGLLPELSKPISHIENKNLYPGAFVCVNSRLNQQTININLDFLIGFCSSIDGNKFSSWNTVKILIPYMLWP